MIGFSNRADDPHRSAARAVARVVTAASIVAIAALCTAPSAYGQYKPLTFDEVNALPAPAADFRVAYGRDSSQFGELRIPTGKGPFPIIEIVHGGCWLSQYDLGYTRAMAAAFVKEGYAVWSIEYRRVGNAGGGFPGTFLDVASATDKLRELARHHPLDTSRLVVVGHSAGGQLAVWLATRSKIAKDSPFATRRPMHIGGVVSLEGVMDMRAFGAAPGSCNTSVASVMGGTPAEYSERYAQLSPIELLPIGVPVRLLNGFADRIVAREQASSFAAKAHAAGDDVSFTLLEREGHFDVMSPFVPAWAQVLGAVRGAMPEPSVRGNHIKRRQ